MKIKRFLASNMREAMRLVREEQGPDAVILANHRVPGGVEVVAATDYDAALLLQAARPQQAPREAAVASASPNHGDEKPAPAAAESPSQHVELPALPQPELQQLRQEIGGMRALIESQLAHAAWRELHQRPERLRALRTMLDIGLDPEMAREIIAELPHDADAERARYLPLGLLARRIPVLTEDPLAAGGVLALVGPTGAGKTTTIAKLAARYAQRFGTRDLALVSTDHYRVGAQEQLFTYGRLLGVPVHSAGNAEELRQVLGRLSDRKLVLIDTAGIGPRDLQLQQQLGELGAVRGRLQTWLVLPAATQAGDLNQIVHRYGDARPSACVLSKIDETLRIGGALSAAIRSGLPITYVCDGQRVPEDLQLARADQLVLRAMQLARSAPAREIDDAALALQIGALHAIR